MQRYGQKWFYPLFPKDRVVIFVFGLLASLESPLERLMGGLQTDWLRTWAIEANNRHTNRHRNTKGLTRMTTMDLLGKPESPIYLTFTLCCMVGTIILKCLLNIHIHLNWRCKSKRKWSVTCNGRDKCKSST